MADKKHAPEEEIMEKDDMEQDQAAASSRNNFV